MSPKPSECNRCDYVMEELEWYPVGGEGGEWLCILCAGTHGGPFVSAEAQKIIWSMCYVGNAIIAAIKEKTP